MAKGLTRCNVCGRTAEQVFECQMLISIHERIGYGSNLDGFTEKCAINPMKENF